MIYQDIHKGIFLKRPNRFIAHVLVDNKEQIVHVKNTGRCKELLLAGAIVYVQYHDNPKRKTKYSLISVEKNGQFFNIDSQVPNEVVSDALAKGLLNDITIPTYIKRESTYKKSRFDIYFENNSQKAYMEIKGVTLETNGVARFPDAPTTRGEKHVREMIEAVNEGYKGYLFFLLQMTNCHYFTPNRETDSSFSNALLEAKKQGVNILCYDSIVSKNGISINKPIPIKLKE